MQVTGYVNYDDKKTGQLIFQARLDDGRQFSIDLKEVPAQALQTGDTQYIRVNSVLMVSSD